MRPAPLWFRALLRTASVVPPMASASAWRLFWRLGSPSAVRASEQLFHETARVSEIDGVAVYEWGTGPETVLLVHGWRSRSSRFATLGTELVARGFRVVAIDAPGHGGSHGTRTHAIEFAHLIAELASRTGRFEAIVAHSFGALATFLAVRGGARTKRIVTIAGVHDFATVVDGFSTGIGLSRAAQSHLERKVERWARPFDIDVWRHVVSELDPADTTTSLLVVHDAEDAEVPYGQAVQITEAHTGPVELELTHGLGHNRILSDAGVVDRVADFIQAPTPRELPTTRATSSRKILWRN
jgi:pimeloyl-ACP methyl ester carboxylesterase